MAFDKLSVNQAHGKALQGEQSSSVCTAVGIALV